MCRPSPETMPSVAVRSRLNGLPIAITLSPTASALESPNCSGRTPFGTSWDEIFRTARSLDGSVPITLASDAAASVPKRTLTMSLPSTTCPFVTSVPCLSIRNAVPAPVEVLTETTAGLAAA